MRNALVVASAAVAGVLGAGLVVAPVLATGDGPDGGRGDGPGFGMGFGAGPGMGPQMMRQDRDGDGFGAGPGNGCRGWGGGWRRGAGPASGDLTGAQERTLQEQAVDEKLAHDLYVALGDETGDARFEHVAWSESRHLAAVRELLDRYRLDDPTDGLGAGELPGAAQERYDAMLAEGDDSADAALEVAARFERDDIAGLRAAVRGLQAADVTWLYQHLEMQSRMHLAVFTR